MTTVAEAIKETAETFRHRIKNEFVFNYIFVWLAWNHKPMLMMIFLKGDNLKQQALNQFEAMPWCESSGMPLLITVAVVLIHPWVNWFVARYKNELVVPKLIEQQELPKRVRAEATLETLRVIRGVGSVEDLETELKKTINRIDRITQEITSKRKALDNEADEMAEMLVKLLLYCREITNSSVKHLEDAIKESIENKIIAESDGNILQAKMKEKVQMPFDNAVNVFKTNLPASALKNLTEKQMNVLNGTEK
tara:strand:+ start:168 stop:920 length:753 start_codon:yes stop_codon:yes gene_type:complete